MNSKIKNGNTVINIEQMNEKEESGRILPGIMIAALKSGSGKTTVTCALLEALKNRGISVCAFKCGPDYIDPMFHREALGVPSYNLDSFFCDEEELKELYLNNRENNELAVIEGAMGLFDGLGGIREEGSAYHIASILQLPILLVVDANGCGRSILSILKGILSDDREKRIKGIILNRISEHFYASIAPLIESELQLAVFGFLPKKKELVIESRHLGLQLPKEIKALQKQIGIAAGLLEKNVSIHQIIEKSRTKGCTVKQKLFTNEQHFAEKKYVRIGVARDEAFCFYYEENLKLLECEGAELVFFSPLHDEKLPGNLNGIILGGGYPENYAEKLEKNSSMRASIYSAIEDGMPSLAECGGFMYLHELLEDDKGNPYHMCGVLPGKCFYSGKLLRFGYVEIKEKKDCFLKKDTGVKGHEFHYYDSNNNGMDCTAEKPVTKQSWKCIHAGENYFWGFPHLYYPSNPDFVKYFIKAAEKFKKKLGD